MVNSGGIGSVSQGGDPSGFAMDMIGVLIKLFPLKKQEMNIFLLGVEEKIRGKRVSSCRSG